MDEVNCTIGEGQGKDLTLHFTINKLKIATAPLHQTKKKKLSYFVPSIDDNDASQGIFIEGEGKVNSGNTIEGTTDGEDPATGKKKKLTIVGENFGLPN